MNKLYIAILFVLFNMSAALSAPSLVSSIEDGLDLSQKTGMPLLVIFGAENCVYCGKLKSDLNQDIFDDSLDAMIVCYVDVGSEKDIQKKYSVRSIPDSRIFDDGKEVSKIVGYNKTKYQEWLNNANK